MNAACNDDPCRSVATWRVNPAIAGRVGWYGNASLQAIALCRELLRLLVPLCSVRIVNLTASHHQGAVMNHMHRNVFAENHGYEHPTQPTRRETQVAALSGLQHLAPGRGARLAERRQAASAAPVALRIPVGTNLDDVERWMIFATLRQCAGNKTRAAALLGVSLKTLYNRLNAYRAAGVGLQDGLQEGQALAGGAQQATALHEAMIEVP